MKAVNLVPSDTRSRQARLSTSPQMLAAIGGLALILLAAVLYVSAANTVSTSKRELAQVTAGAASWTAAANRYAPFLQAAERNTQQLAEIRALATTRFPWSRLLSQISGLMPRAAALSVLHATTTPTATTATSTAAAPTVRLTGCASSHATVAQAMVQLRRINGVSAVTLTSSADITVSASASGGSGAANQGSNGGCPFPVQFQVSLTFGASSAAGAATSSGAPAASAAATSAPATAASATAATGAAQ